MSAVLRDARAPKYCRMRRPGKTDSAYVKIDGRRVYLGAYGSPESRQKYAEVLAPPDLESVTAVGPSNDPTVSELILGYLKHAQTYYRNEEGELSREYDQQKQALRQLHRAAGNKLAREFGPRLLQEIREEWIDKNLTGKHINNQIRRIVGAFRWGVAQELVPPATLQALTAVRGLRKGRSRARASKVVRPVSDDVVEQTLPELPEVVADMVRVQRLSGIRPGELVRMRPMDLDRTGDVWIYRPPKHKTERLGHSRVVGIGPRAQDVLLRYLVRAADAPLFQPRDSEAKRRVAAARNRKTPLSCGNRSGTNRSADPKRSAGTAYSVDSYRRAVQRAAKRANVERWTPHQLRHTAATEIRKEHGLDAAQAVLGHRHADVTQIYAELDLEKVVEVARALG